MDEVLAAIAQRDGVFLTREAYALGYDDYAIARAVRGGAWHRVRRGAFVPAMEWEGGDPVVRHKMRAAAVHRSYGDRVVFSHTTAAILHGLNLWGTDLSRIHVTRLDGGAGRTERDVVHHESTCFAPGDVVSVGGWLTTNPTRAALETGVLGSTESALVTLDHLLNSGKGSPRDIGNCFDVVQHWPGTQHLQVAVRMADGRAQSPGETRSRWLFFVQGLPAPELQFEVRDASGALIGITDFVWLRHRLLGEFDGRVKYGRLLRAGQSGGDVVFDEKRREDELRRQTGYAMERLIWVDLDHPAATGARVRRRLGLAA